MVNQYPVQRAELRLVEMAVIVVIIVAIIALLNAS
jgi:Tfp pilus assembly protein PilE